MSSFVAPGVLSLGAGAALYNFGYQGQYKEDVAVASSAALTVFAVLSVVQRLVRGFPSTDAASSGETKKKKKNKTKKVMAESDDSDSPSTEKAPKLKGDAGSAKGNKSEAKKADKTKKPEKAEKVTKTEKSEQAPKGKGKEEKKEATQQLDKKGDKQNAKTKVTEASKVEQKASSKNASKDVKKGAESAKEAKKGETSKDAKKGQPTKANENAKKSKKQEDSEESEDDEALRIFLRLGQKNTGSLSTSRAPVVRQEESDEEDSDEDEAPAKAELSNSKSAIRRRKQKENKEKAVAAAAAETFTKPSKKAVVDKDGFETVATTRRPAKKPVAAAATAASGSSDSKTETKSAPTNFSDTIEMESKQIALLVGPKGETMNALKEACGGNIRIDTPARDSTDKKVTVSGEEASVKHCLKQIRELMTKGYCSALSPGTSSSTMAVPGIAQAILVGPGGVNIQKIQKHFGVIIKTPAKTSGSEQITISGPKDAIKKTKETIRQIIEHGFSSVTHEGYEVGEVAFPRSELRHLIGPGGHTIKSIQGDTKTKVKIPDESAENQNIQVVGPAEGVAKAIKQIATLLERKAAKEAAAAEAATLNSDDDDGY